MARTPVCDCVRVRVLNVRVRVLGMRERVLGMRERVRGYTRPCPLMYQWVPWVWRSYGWSTSRLCRRAFPPTYANIHLARASPLETAICLMRFEHGG